MDTLDGVAALRSLETHVAALRSLEAGDQQPPQPASLLADLVDSHGDLPFGVTATSDGLQFVRPDVAATDTPPPMLWPLDGLVDESELTDWRSRPLAVDLGELRRGAVFYQQEYGVDVERLFARYRPVWDQWAISQSRAAESAELFDALHELAQTSATKVQNLYLSAWRLTLPEYGIDTRLARRRAKLKMISTRNPRYALFDDDDEGIRGQEVGAIVLAVEPQDALHYDTRALSAQLGSADDYAFRPSLVERNDLPLGSHVRQRVLADIRPWIQDGLRARFGDGVEWSLTMSPALLISDHDRSTTEDALEGVTALRGQLSRWPGIATASERLLEGAPGALSALEQELTRILHSVGISDLLPSGTVRIKDSALPVPTKFRDRLRARTGTVDPLLRFRDRRRAAAAAAAEQAASLVGVDTPAAVAVPDSLDESDPTSGSYTLDERQRSVAEASPSDRLVVVAGAGQGKTEVVAARLEHLASEHELSLSTEVLVLSFSRAAVSAVRKRLATRVLAGAEIRTFDSFASRVIIDAEQEPTGSFNARIEHATRLLLDDDVELPMLDDVRHVVLDEVQDLVGKRAKLALALIARAGADVGLTALGDPNQALYDFQLTDTERAHHSEVLDDFGDLENVRVTRLTQNFRARGPVPLAVVDLGQRLRTMNDGAAARGEVGSFIEALPRIEAETWLADVYRAGRTTAVLTKTNGDALRVSQLLTSLKVRHTLRRPSQEQGASAWVSELARLLPRVVNRRDDVIAALEFTSVADPTDAWNVLKEAEGVFRSPEDLDMSRIRRVIGGYGIPTALLADTTEDVVISTVHRAKGLEFDRVFLLDTDHESDQDDFAIARRNYVALSRARDEVRRCAPKTAKSWMKKDSAPPGRWMEKSFGKGGKQLTRSIEFRNGDIDTDSPFSTADAASSMAAQELLASGRVTGRSVTLELDREWSHRDAPIYLVRGDDGEVFGRTNEDFGRSVKRLFTVWQYAYPMVMTGVTVMTVESVTGTPEVCAEAGLGESGIWLAPQLSGLVRPLWDQKWDGMS